MLCDSPRAGARRVDGESAGKFRSQCGTAPEVSDRVGRCLDKIFEMIEGRLPEPKNDEDLVGACNRFNECDKCVRGVSKECLSGLHKTATSTVASAMKRFRTQECSNKNSRAKYTEPLKCAIKKGKDMSSIFKNHTGIAQGIRDLPIAAEEKLIKMCCLLNSLDREIERSFNAECPKSTPLVIGIIHAITDDARNTLCVNPKCSHALDPVLKSRYKPTQNFIEPVMEVMFMLNTD